MNPFQIDRRLTAGLSILMAIGCLTLSGCKTDNGGNDGRPSADNPDPNGGGKPAAIAPPAKNNPPRPEQSGSNPLKLLQNDAVKKEISLTDEQVSKIKALESELHDKIEASSKTVKEKFQAIEKSPKDQQEAAKKKLATEIESGLAALSKESQAKMKEILKPEQEKRAKEIVLQKFDFGIVTKDDFAADLKLTDAQRTKLNDIVGQMRNKTVAAWEIPDKDDVAKREKTLKDNKKRMEAVMKESNQQAKAVLTPEQLKTLETLKGKSVSFSLSDIN